MYDKDQRYVLTLDAGGTNFVFSAIQADEEVVSPYTLPSNAQDLEKCLDTLEAGFRYVRDQVPADPVAISFAFPGPSDYPQGIIGDLVNLPAFRGGVAIGPMLEEIFGIPVYINNDGDLFAYGEALAGFLPWINGKLRSEGSEKQFRNLLGITLGTGFGGGIVANGQLLEGDNAAASEVWALHNKFYPRLNAEESISIRGVRKFYAEASGITFDEAPDPHQIYRIASGEAKGDTPAAIKAYALFGEVLGDALANILTILDGIVVLGGGIVGAADMFMESMINELNSKLEDFHGNEYHRLYQWVYNLEDSRQMQKFLEGNPRTIKVPRSERTLVYDSHRRTGVGISRLGASKAISLGAYHYALNKIDTVVK